MASLKQTAVRGASWAVGARLGRTLLGLVTLGVLSRYIGPAEFGIAALVTFVTSFAQIFADFGTRVALVQRKTITRLEEDSVYWSNVALGLISMAVILIFARPIAGLMGDEAVTEPLRWISPIFLLVALQGLPATTLERRLAFRQIATAEIASSVVSGAVAILMALSGYRIEALIAQQMALTATGTLLYILFSGWWPRFQFSMDALRPLMSYGRYVTGAGIVQFFAASADRPIIGNRLDPADLGYFTMAGQIVSTPMRVVVQMVRRVMFPIMSSIQDDEDRMRRGILDVQYGLAVVMAPICFGLWGLAAPTVRILLGPGWEVVAAIMGYTALRVFFNVYTDVNGILFASKGHAKFQFYWSIFSLAASIAVLLATVSYGVVAISAARLVLSMVLVPLNSWFAVRLIGMPLADRMLVSLPPIVSAALMGIAVWLVDRELAGQGLGALVRMLIGVPLGVVVYVALESVIDRRRFLPFARMMLGLIRRRRRAA